MGMIQRTQLDHGSTRRAHALRVEPGVFRRFEVRRETVAQHGDPRDPKIDAVDWVEPIPLAETRNYVQRVMENLQVYRVRFGASIATVEPNLHRAAAVEPRTQPASLERSVPQ
jgi:hypothetical protein